MQKHRHSIRPKRRLAKAQKSIAICLTRERIPISEYSDNRCKRRLYRGVQRIGRPPTTADPILEDTVITIDGSKGEGGGQVLRTALALSLSTGRPFRIIQLRARRRRPGLRRQHLVCVEAAAAIGAARTTGAKPGSQELSFVPRSVHPGNYQFDIGTAGSTTLVLQSVLPALILAQGPSQLTLCGGTHNPLAPTYDFFARAYVPLLKQMGGQLQVALKRQGYYPKGGGQVAIAVQPVPALSCLHINERGRVLTTYATAVVVGLPRHIAERELRTIARSLKLDPTQLEVQEQDGQRGPANVVTLEIQSEYVTEVFTAFGARGIRAETVGARVAHDAGRYLQANVPVGEHLADQMLLPMALAGEGSLTTLPPTPHTITNCETIRHFLDLRIEVYKRAGNVWRIELLR